MKITYILLISLLLGVGLFTTYGFFTNHNTQYLAKGDSGSTGSTGNSGNSGSNSGTDNTGVISAITDLPAKIGTSVVNSAKNSIYEDVQNSSQEMLTKTFAFVFQTPDLKSFCVPFTSIMNLITGLYGLFLLLIGVYFVLGSMDVEDRIRAKKYFRNFIIVMAVLSLSFYFYQLLLGINNYITGYVSQNFVVNNIFSFPPNIGNSFLVIFLLIFSMLMMLFVGLSLLIRYLLIPFLLLVFPIAIVLFVLPFTREFGKTILKVTLITIFMTSIDALFLYASSFLFSGDTLGSGIMKVIAVIASFALLSFLNLFLYFWAFLPSFEQAKEVIQASAFVGEFLA
ncbi:Uncharacterised protein [uncultured archaeon]|nr:Uncharacterised protein [uncultured archaeon]